MFSVFLRFDHRIMYAQGCAATLYDLQLQLSRGQPVLDLPHPNAESNSSAQNRASYQTSPHILASNCPGSMDGHSKSRGTPFISEDLTRTADQRDAM